MTSAWPRLIEDLEVVPRTIVKSRRGVRIVMITGLFAAGGVLIYFTARPFAESLLALATVFGVPSFVMVQWVAPLISEFPEMASTVYFARTVNRAPMALMNMVSSNINQWTLLVAMLPIVYSISLGHAEVIPLDPQQRVEILMTLGQALVAMLFLLKMSLAWSQAAALLALFLIPFVHPPAEKIVTIVYFAWAGVELIRMIRDARMPAAMRRFAETYRAYVSAAGTK